MNTEKNNNVVIYLTGNKEKDNAVKKFCKDKKLNIVKTFRPHMDESDQYWNSAIFEMYFELLKLNKEYQIKNIITYNLEELFWCTYDQVAISLMFFDIDIDIFTLKEGNINEEDAIKISLTINKKEIKQLKKYWTDKDKQNYGRLKNEKSK